MVAKAGRGWKLAPSLAALIDEVDDLWPKRSKASDGSIGDAAHKARTSDHNPSNGWVVGLDLTHDPDGGFDSYNFAELLRERRDSRVKYVISNGRIFDSKTWAWKDYKGDAHTHHVHVSVKNNKAAREDVSAWFKGVTPAHGGGPQRNLQQGMSGEDVRVWQTILQGAGLLGEDEADGIFGPKTKEATIRFQWNLGVSNDGIVGPHTRQMTDKLLRALAELGM